MKNKIIMVFISLMLLVSSITGCTKSITQISAEGVSNETTVASAQSYEGMVTVEYSDRDKAGTWSEAEATKITLDDDATQIVGSGATFEQGNVVVSKEGTYVFTGSLKDGQIIVTATDTEKVQLVLNNATISNSDSSAIYIKEADKVFLTLAEGTSNTVSDAADYNLTYEEDAPNAAIFSMADLTINGTGELTVNGNYGHGIYTKDDLMITGGNFNITSVKDSIRGKDCVAILTGTFDINAGGDGIQANNDADTSKGYIAIEGGTFNITSEGDGIQAESVLQIKEGAFEIFTAGGSANASILANGATNDTWGKPTDNTGEVQSSTTVSTTEDEISAKALKSSGTIFILGGTYHIDSSDDALHANKNVTMANGTIDISSGDDGIHADETLTLDGGKVTIVKSYEGLEAANILINDGTFSVTSSDDGLNAAGGNDGSSVNGRTGQNSFNQVEDASIIINGGNLWVDAQGDGIDSNGTLEINGGTIADNGPTNNGNGALDYNGTGTINAGTLVASGSSGMAMTFTNNETQGTIMVNFSSTVKANTLIALVDENDKTILCYASNKDFQNIVLSAPEIVLNKTYTLYVGGSHSGALTNGYYTEGTYSKGAETVSITMDSLSEKLSDDGTDYTNSGRNGMPKGERPTGTLQGIPPERSADMGQIPSNDATTQATPTTR